VVRFSAAQIPFIYIFGRNQAFWLEISGCPSRRKHIIDIAGELPTILLEFNLGDMSIKETYIYVYPLFVWRATGYSPKYYGELTTAAVVPLGVMLRVDLVGVLWS
jgi:hypothetical protein